MLIPKDIAIRSPKYLAAARDQTCIRCGATDGAIVACHYFGVFRHSLGGGMSNKVGDIFTADFCRTCHEFFDTYKHAGGNDYERVAEFMLFIMLTFRRRIDQGVVTIGRAK